MKILITEQQLKRIVSDVSEQNDIGFDRRYGTVDAATKSNSDNRALVNTAQNWYKQNAHTVNAVLSLGTLFIPVVGPILSTSIAGYDLKLSYDEAKTNQERAMVAFGAVLMLMPGLKSGLSLTAPAIKNMSSAGLIQIGKKLISNKVNELTTIEKQVVSEVGANQKQISAAINNKPRFNLERGPKAPKKRWDYQKNSMGNDLEFVGKPKGSENVAEVRNVETPTESVALKKRTSENGTEYYFFSANMPSSPIKAARAMNMLKSKIPSGARFGEPTTGSLSTDSFYSMLRRTKEGYIPKVENMITLNKQGSKRFQNDIQNSIQHDYSDIRFSTYQDAQVLSNGLNKEISKAGINVPSKVVKDVDGYYNIKIPNIQYFKK